MFHIFPNLFMLVSLDMYVHKCSCTGYEVETKFKSTEEGIGHTRS